MVLLLASSVSPQYAYSSGKYHSGFTYPYQAASQCSPASISDYAYTAAAYSAPDLTFSWSDRVSAGSYNYPPDPPTDLLCNKQQNPRLTSSNLTPRFSAIYRDRGRGYTLLWGLIKIPIPDYARYYQVQVEWRGSLSVYCYIPGPNGQYPSKLVWDSGKRSMNPTPVNTRCPDIVYQGPALSPGQRYAWRIKFWDSEGAEGAWSAWAGFTTNTRPTTGNLKVEGQTNPTKLTTTTPAFSWEFCDSDRDSQSRYEIWVGTSPGSSNVWNSGQVASSSTSVRYSGPSLSRGTKYYVQVRTSDGYEWSDWTGGTFTINRIPDVSGLSAGGGEITTKTPTITWTYTDADGDPQSHYQVQVWTGSNGTGTKTWDTGEVSGSAGAVIYAGTALEEDRTYYVRVRVKDGYEWSGWREISFRVKPLPFIKIKNGYFFDPVKNEYWLPHGIAYQTWNRPLGVWQTFDQIEYDLSEMEKAHVNSIRVDFVWKHIEENGDNVFNWANYDYLLEAAARHNIRVFALIGYQWPPDWFPDEWYTMHPPGYDWEGKYHETPWKSDIINFEHPEARKQYTEFLQAVASRYRDNPTVVAWILGNEYGYLGLWSVKQDGYDPWCQSAFRRWLSTFYNGNINALNEAWGTSYGSFDEVRMPEEYNRDSPAWWDLVQWRENSIANFVAIGARAVKQADPNHLITYSTVGMQWGEEDWRYHAEDGAKIAKACADIGAPLDFWSVNNYPWGMLGHESQTGQWGIVAAKWRTGLPVLYTETGFTSSETMYPGINEGNQGDLIRNSLWEALETGAIGVHVFTWQDRRWVGLERERGFGIVYGDRRVKPALWVVRDTYNLMDQIGLINMLVGSSSPTPDVAFYWTEATDSMYNRYECEMQQLYGALERIGLEPAFINREQLLAGEYRKYKAIILPRNMRMHPGDLEFIRTKVIPSGVHVFADADLPGMQDYHVKPLSDFVSQIEQIFGINASNTGGFEDPVRNEQYGIDFKHITVTVRQNLPPLLSGRADDFMVWKYSDQTVATTGTVVATHSNGSPALVLKDHGTAKAAITTFSLGDQWSALDWGQLPNIKRWEQRYDWMSAIFNGWFNIRGPIAVTGSKYVLVDYRTCADGSVLISLKNYLNDSSQTVTLTTAMLAGKDVEALCGGGIIEERSDGTVTVTLPPNGHELLRGVAPAPPVQAPRENQMWRSTASRTASYSSGPQGFPLSLKWTKDLTEPSLSIVPGNSPLVTDGALYVRTSGQRIEALWPSTGVTRWSFTIDPSEGTLEGLMAIADGILYVGTRNPGNGAKGAMYAINADTGALVWKYATDGFNAAPPAVVNGTVYFGSSDGYVHALDAKTGALRWKRSVNGTVYAGVAVKNNTVYAGSTNGYVYAIDAGNGNLKWSAWAGNYVDSTPAVEYGKVYICADNWSSGAPGAILRAFNESNGALAWTAVLPGYYVNHSSPAVANNMVYVASSNNRLYAFDASTGAVKWSAEFPGNLAGSIWGGPDPTVGNGVVYISPPGYKVYALNASNGGKIWEYELPYPCGEGRRSPVTKNGWAFFITPSRLYAFSDGSSWPLPAVDKAPVLRILDAPALVHPFGDKCYQVKVRYDTRGYGLTLKVAFQEDGDAGDGKKNEIYYAITKTVSGSGDETLWMYIPDPNLSDPDYKSTPDGGRYVFHAWLEAPDGTKLADAYHPTILSWGIAPTAPLPTSLAQGRTYDLSFEWENLYEYLWWEVTPLSRETAFPVRVLVVRSSKTESMYPGHLERTNEVCDWLESIGYVPANPSEVRFDDVSATAVKPSGSSGYSISITKVNFNDDFNDGNADGWSRANGCARWRVISGEYSVDRLSQDINISVAGDSSWTDFTLETKFKYQKNDPYFKEVYLVFRYQDPNNFYYVGPYNYYGWWKLKYGGRVNGSDFSGILCEMPPLANGVWHSLKVVASGSNFKVYLNGNYMGEFNHSALSRGKIGVGARAAQLGNWEPQRAYYLYDDTERGTNGTVLNLDWGYLKEFYGLVILPGVYVMSDQECYNIREYLKSGMFAVMAIDGCAGIKKPDGSDGAGRLEDVFGVGTSYLQLTGKTLRVADHGHYITHDYQVDDVIGLAQNTGAMAWTTTTTGRAWANVIDGSGRSVPAMITNQVGTSKVLVFNFAANTGGQMSGALSTISRRAIEWTTREIYKLRVELKCAYGNQGQDDDLVVAHAETWTMDESGRGTFRIKIPMWAPPGSGYYWTAYCYPWDSAQPWTDHMGFYTSLNDPGYGVSVSGTACYWVYNDAGIPGDGDVYTWPSSGQFDAKYYNVRNIPEGTTCFRTSSPVGWPGWGVFLVKPTTHTVDLSKYSYLRVFVKTDGGASPAVGVQQDGPSGKKAEVSLAAYGLTSTTDWQVITIPKSAFSGIDFTRIYSPFYIYYPNGTYYVDDVMWF
jgi:outer membrane protein assembly factor BamB